MFQIHPNSKLFVIASEKNVGKEPASSIESFNHSSHLDDLGPPAKALSWKICHADQISLSHPDLVSLRFPQISNSRS